MTGAVTHWVHSFSDTRRADHRRGEFAVGSSNRDEDYTKDDTREATFTRDRRDRRQDSWVDAVVTLLATVIFGLGWVLVELERADPPLNRYDAAASEMWIAAVATSIDARAIDTGVTEIAAVGRPGDRNARWTELALERSSR